MNKICTFLLMLFCIYLSINAQAQIQTTTYIAEGTGGGNGGHKYAAEFSVIAMELMDSFASYTRFFNLRKYNFNSRKFNKLGRMLKDARILSTCEILKGPDGLARTMLNFGEIKVIKFNLAQWSRKPESSENFLVMMLHELMGMAGLEAGDSFYYSSGLIKVLKSEMEKFGKPLDSILESKILPPSDCPKERPTLTSLIGSWTCGDVSVEKKDGVLRIAGDVWPNLIEKHHFDDVLLCLDEACAMAVQMSDRHTPSAIIFDPLSQFNAPNSTLRHLCK